jgi:plastocyanin
MTKAEIKRARKEAKRAKKKEPKKKKATKGAKGAKKAKTKGTKAAKGKGKKGPTPRTPVEPKTRAGQEASLGQEASTGAEDAGIPPAEQVTPISMRDFQFIPMLLRVPKGTTITWNNEDSMDHVIDGKGAFPSSPTLSPGQSFSYTFDTPGTFTYSCALHPEMFGTVDVLP